MKVLHIIDSLGLGGAQTVVKGIFEKQKDNKNIFLYSLRKREISLDIDHKNIFINNSNKKYSFAPIKELKELIEKEKIDVLHCHLFKAQFFGWILKRKYFPKIKLILHEHGQIFQRNYYYNKFMNIAQKQTDLFLAVSKATKEKLKDKAKINPDKIKVLYNFVDLDKFNKKNIKIDINKEKEKLGIKKDEFVIGFAGRLIKRKGWREFIETSRILSKDNNFKFLIAGDGEDKKKMLKLIKKYKLEDKTKFLGYQKNMVNFYALLNCFVIPSHWEPMGLTELEAQSCKCPIIVSNVEGLNEVVKEKVNCLLFNPKDSKKLSKKILKIKENKKLKENLIKEGLKNTKQYSLVNYLKELKKVYLKV